MDSQTALQILTNIAAQVSMVYADHVQVQTALSTLAKAIEPKEEAD